MEIKKNSGEKQIGTTLKKLQPLTNRRVHRRRQKVQRIKHIHAINGLDIAHHQKPVYPFNTFLSFFFPTQKKERP